MLTAIEHYQHVHLRTQIDIASRRRILLFEFQLPLLIDGNSAKEVYVRHQIGLAQSPLAELDQELISRVPIKFVTPLLKTRDSVFLLHHRCGRMTPHWLGPATSIRLI